MTPSIESFETARLRAERVGEQHFGEIHQLWRDERVMALVGGIRTEEKARRTLQAMLDHWAQYGFGRWAWREPRTGAFVGLAGLRCMTLDGWPEVSLGYLLLPEFWGKGLATEIARQVAALAFEQLGMESVVALTTPDNPASRRVLGKIGMLYNRETTLENLPRVLYEITHAQWAQSQPPR